MKNTCANFRGKKTFSSEINTVTLTNVSFLSPTITSRTSICDGILIDYNVFKRHILLLLPLLRIDNNKYNDIYFECAPLQTSLNGFRPNSGYCGIMLLTHTISRAKYYILYYDNIIAERLWCTVTIKISRYGTFHREILYNYKLGTGKSSSNIKTVRWTDFFFHFFTLFTMSLEREAHFVKTPAIMIL